MNLNQVTLTVTNLQASIEFYQNIGLTLIVNSPANAYARFECPDGEATLSLHEDDVIGSTANFYFEVPDVMARYDELKAIGISFEHAPKAQRWLWTEAWFQDPDGHRLCIFYAGENRKNPPWRVDS